jgi:hypothetical protein
LLIKAQEKHRLEVSTIELAIGHEHVLLEKKKTNEGLHWQDLSVELTSPLL